MVSSLFVCGFAVLLIKWLLYCRLPTCVLVMAFLSFVGMSGSVSGYALYNHLAHFLLIGENP